MIILLLRKLLMQIIPLWLKKIETNLTALNFKIGGRVKITKCKKNIPSKGYIKNWLKETFVIDSVLKINPWTYEIKHLTEKE